MDLRESHLLELPLRLRLLVHSLPLPLSLTERASGPHGLELLLVAVAVAVPPPVPVPARPPIRPRNRTSSSPRPPCDGTADEEQFNNFSAYNKRDDEFGRAHLPRLRRLVAVLPPLYLIVLSVALASLRLLAPAPPCDSAAIDDGEFFM